MRHDLRVISVQVLASSPALRVGLAAMLASAAMEVVGAAAEVDDLPAIAGRVVVMGGPGWPEDAAQLADDEALAGLVLLADAAAVAARALHGLALPAWAVLPPAASPEQLQAAVAAVASGLVVVPPEAWTVGQAVQVTGGDLPEPLTGREREVLQLLAEGLSNKLVARRLRISEHTVKFHVSSIYAKLGASNRTEAVSHAARRGLVTL